jgi:hypothetical protein
MEHRAAPGSRDKEAQAPKSTTTANGFLQEIERRQRISMASKEKEAERRVSGEEDINYVVYVRLPFKRGDFQDPPPVSPFALCSYQPTTGSMLKLATSADEMGRGQI